MKLKIKVKLKSKSFYTVKDTGMTNTESLTPLKLAS